MTAFMGDEESVLAALALEGNAWKLALPMTLNNLAGGVAGGLAGVGALELGIGSFLASYAMMWTGHVLGCWIQSWQSTAAAKDAEEVGTFVGERERSMGCCGLQLVANPRFDARVCHGAFLGLLQLRILRAARFLAGLQLVELLQLLLATLQGRLQQLLARF